MQCLSILFCLLGLVSLSEPCGTGQVPVRPPTRPTTTVAPIVPTTTVAPIVPTTTLAPTTTSTEPTTTAKCNPTCKVADVMLAPRDGVPNGITPTSVQDCDKLTVSCAAMPGTAGGGSALMSFNDNLVEYKKGTPAAKLDVELTCTPAGWETEVDDAGTKEIVTKAFCEDKCTTTCKADQVMLAPRDGATNPLTPTSVQSCDKLTVSCAAVPGTAGGGSALMSFNDAPVDYKKGTPAAKLDVELTCTPAGWEAEVDDAKTKLIVTKALCEDKCTPTCKVADVMLAPTPGAAQGITPTSVQDCDKLIVICTADPAPAGAGNAAMKFNDEMVAYTKDPAASTLNAVLTCTPTGWEVETDAQATKLIVTKIFCDEP